MTEEEIIEDWFRYDSNIMGLNIIAYNEEIYNFIVATCPKISNGNYEVYKVNGDWQIITIKKELQ